MKTLIYIIKRIKCLFGYHEPFTGFSFKTGAYHTVCDVCGKTLAKSNGGNLK